MNTYARLPVQFDKGEGVWLWDTEGNRYFDALGGIAVCGLGHAHPAVTAAICEQAAKLVHTSNLYGIPNQTELAQKLCQHSGMDRVFFGNSGAEANEAAIKIARKTAHQRGIKNPKIIVTDGSFHGRTLATLSATGNPKVREGFAPLVEGFVHVPYNDLSAIRTVIDAEPGVVAVMVEPVQGEAGINIPDAGYLLGIRQLCDQNDCLMMLDEIQTGLCRSGAWFAFQHQDLQPDVMTLAKALGNGVPIGACLARGEAAEMLVPGNHGSTYGGNPLVCSAALATIGVLESENLAQRAATLGHRIVEGFKAELVGVAGVKEVRGLGLLLAIELDEPCADLVSIAMMSGLIINVAGGNRIRLLPPLIMTDEQASQLVQQLSALIKSYLSREDK